MKHVSSLASDGASRKGLKALELRGSKVTLKRHEFCRIKRWLKFDVFQQSREGISLILKLIHESRLQPLALASTGTVFDRPGSFDRPVSFERSHSFTVPSPSPNDAEAVRDLPSQSTPITTPPPAWQKVRDWFQWY